MKTTNIFSPSFWIIVILTTVMFSYVFIFAHNTYAQELPFGVSPQEVVESGSIPLTGEGLLFGLNNNGDITMSYEYKVGNRIGVKVDEVEYELKF